MFVEIEDEEAYLIFLRKDLLRLFIERYFEYRDTERQQEARNAPSRSIAA